MYKYNAFTRSYYMYDSDEHDICSEMFDESLHDNESEPPFVGRLTCGYCQTRFLTRNRLFHHLGYMNIDIRKNKTDDVMVVEDTYNEEMGDFGFTMHMTHKDKRRKNKQKRYKYYMRQSLLKKRGLKPSNKALKSVLDQFQYINLTGH
jgi:hypothetical protein